MADRKGSVLSRATNAAATSDPSSTTGSGSSTPAVMANARAPSPYGTRSRWGARVNYAEDKDNEMDYEFTPPYTAPKTNGTAEGAGAATRRQSTVVGNGKDPKEPTAFQQTFNAPAGKKRKGGSGHSSANGNGNGTAMTVQTPNSTLREISLTNMLSFDRPFLKDGKLVAETGQCCRLKVRRIVAISPIPRFWRWCLQQPLAPPNHLRSRNDFAMLIAMTRPHIPYLRTPWGALLSWTYHGVLARQ